MKRSTAMRILTIFMLSFALIAGASGGRAHAQVPTVATVASVSPKAAVIPKAAVVVKASTTTCPAWYTCTVYFTKSETSAFGNWGQVPPIPSWLPWQMKGAYWGVVYGLRWFAKQYANRGMCSGYRFSLVPWASQGYFGYYC